MLITFGEEEREELIDFDDFSDLDEAEMHHMKMEMN
jgi:hypothetical protein